MRRKRVGQRVVVRPAVAKHEPHQATAEVACSSERSCSGRLADRPASGTVHHGDAQVLAPRSAARCRPETAPRAAAGPSNARCLSRHRRPVPADRISVYRDVTQRVLASAQLGVTAPPPGQRMVLRREQQRFQLVGRFERSRRSAARLGTRLRRQARDRRLALRPRLPRPGRRALRETPSSAAVQRAQRRRPRPSGRSSWIIARRSGDDRAAPWLARPQRLEATLQRRRGGKVTGATSSASSRPSAVSRQPRPCGVDQLQAELALQRQHLFADRRMCEPAARGRRPPCSPAAPSPRSCAVAAASALCTVDCVSGGARHHWFHAETR
jgi:hypothetical protein